MLKKNHSGENRWNTARIEGTISLIRKLTKEIDEVGRRSQLSSRESHLKRMHEDRDIYYRLERLACIKCWRQFR